MILPALVLTALVGGAVDVPTLPAPLGPHAVGRSTFTVSDSSRPEPFTSDVSDHRVLNIEMWYPAEPAEGDGVERERYLDDEAVAAFAEAEISEVEFLSAVHVFARTGAPVVGTEERLPVVVFSHGHGTHPSLYTGILAEIASHGYVVVAINHTYSSTISRLSPDRVVTFRTPWEEGAPWSEQGIHMERLVQLWGSDVLFILNWLETLTDRSDSQFYGRLDVGSIVGMGHSLGGPSIGQAAMRDQRLRGTIHLDSSIYGGKRIVHDRPLLLMNTESAAINRQFHSGKPGDTYYVIIRGSEHMTYSDAVLLSVLAGEPSRATSHQHAVTMLRKINDLILQFLDKTIHGRPAIDLDIETDIVHM